LLTSTSPKGRTAYLHADIREPADILNAETIDETMVPGPAVVLIATRTAGEQTIPRYRDVA
jgi:hypothetical protein